ncbi:hypothetical protein TPAR_01518 [Tolypocladium paradoxum]|uniref:Secreted protein n=1 Tax=Tolypocladium paradoxum TaxID=94208 RepID=A0A2S4L758_9HYPO|nr:hypothetical protein TPAR_01518 [Tolypocladium paradoxum]
MFPQAIASATAALLAASLGVNAFTSTCTVLQDKCGYNLVATHCPLLLLRYDRQYFRQLVLYFRLTAMPGVDNDQCAMQGRISPLSSLARLSGLG